MNDNCLGELHLLANTLCRYYAVIIYYADTLCKYIIQSNIEDLWLAIVDNQCISKKRRQLNLLLFVLIEDICTYVRTLLSIYMRKMSSSDYENLTTNFDFIYILSKFQYENQIHSWFFIYLY